MRRFSPLFLLSLLVGLFAVVGVTWGVAASAAPACTITFNGTSSSAWGTAANWSPARVPTATDTVCLNADVTTPTTATTVSGFNAAGHSTTMPNTLKVTSYVAGLSGSLRGPGTFSVAAGVSWSIESYYLEAPVVNAGSLVVAGSSGVTLSGSGVSLANTGSVSLGVGVAGTGDSGQVVMNSAGGTISGASNIAVPVTNNGTIVSTATGGSSLQIDQLTLGSGTTTGSVLVTTLRVPSAGASLSSVLSAYNVERVVAGQGALTVASGKSLTVLSSLRVPTTNNGSLRLESYYLEAPVVNAGSLVVAGSSGVTLSGSGVSLANTGSVSLGVGVAGTGDSGQVVMNSAGGTISGSSYIAVPVTNNGTILGTGVSGDALELSSVSLGTTSRLVATVGSGGVGGFTLGNAVALTGYLGVDAASGYTIPAGLTVVPVTDSSGLSATFAAVQDDWWIRTYAATSVSLKYHTLTPATPTITGTPRVGVSLTANPGTTWGPAPVTFAYQWFRAGTAITGATSSTYSPTADDLGKTLTVQVTGSKTGWIGGTAKTSAATAAVQGGP